MCDTIYKVQQIFLNYIKIEYFFFEFLHFPGDRSMRSFKAFKRKFMLKVKADACLFYLEGMKIGGNNLALLIQQQSVAVVVADSVQDNLGSATVVEGDMKLDFVRLLIENILPVHLHLAHGRIDATQHHIYGFAKYFATVVVSEIEVERHIDPVLYEAGPANRLSRSSVYAARAVHIRDHKRDAGFYMQLVQHGQLCIVQVGKFLHQHMLAGAHALGEHIKNIDLLQTAEKDSVGSTDEVRKWG